MTKTQKLASALSAATGLPFEFKDEWATYAHPTFVEMHYGDWEAHVLELAVAPGRGRRPARIIASIIVEGHSHSPIVTADQAKILLAWANAGGVGSPFDDLVAAGWIGDDEQTWPAKSDVWIARQAQAA